MNAEQLRLERIADIEGMGRLANEHMLASASKDATILFRCECGNDVCHEPLAMELDVYEQARQDSMLFLVRPGHELPEAEDVIARGDGYEIVRKHEAVRSVVEKSDPRKQSSA